MPELRQPTAADFERIFAVESSRRYPVIEALEDRYGYAVPREDLLEAARVLACPFKVNPPNWQHGRVLYAMARRYLARAEAAGSIAGPDAGAGDPCFLDIGTAKGFSALMLRWALDHAGFVGAEVHSCDVIEPAAPVRRNTIAEVGGYRTLAEILAPWRGDTERIRFWGCAGSEWLIRRPGRRVHLAFVDGKHDRAVVKLEAELLAACQYAGDLVLFDDVQIAGVREALAEVRHLYTFEAIEVGNLTGRQYAIGERR